MPVFLRSLKNQVVSLGSISLVIPFQWKYRGSDKVNVLSEDDLHKVPAFKRCSWGITIYNLILD